MIIIKLLLCFACVYAIIQANNYEKERLTEDMPAYHTRNVLDNNERYYAE